VISGLNIAERRLPQDGRIQLNIAGRPIDFRVSTLPTQFGESVVLRVLDRSVVPWIWKTWACRTMCTRISPRTSNAQRHHRGDGSDRLRQNHHVLFRVAAAERGEENKLLTAEEPVEYDIDGIVQVNANQRLA
jgi:type IV pilus assembly protein PilB